MKELVERVARRIWLQRYPSQASHVDSIWDAGPRRLRGKPAWTACIPEAKELIAEMREPDGAMEDRGEDACLAHKYYPVPEEIIPRECWVAMIDEALKRATELEQPANE